MRVLKRWYPDKVLTMDTHLYNELELDSLAVMEMTMDIEDMFDVSIPIDQNAETVGDIVCLISREVLRGAERKCEEDCRKAVSTGR